ncbi:MAG: ATP-dependent Clp protease proteolytic subunit, partial [Acidimicrobiales bacterium]
VQGRPSDIAAFSEHHASQLGRFNERLSEATGKPVTQVADDVRRGLFLGAEEAKAYGLVDEIVQRSAQILGFPRTFGFRRA